MAMTEVQPLLNHTGLAFNFKATCYVAEGHDCVDIICMSSVQHLCYFLQSSITDTQYLEMIFSFRIRTKTTKTYYLIYIYYIVVNIVELETNVQT